MNKIRLPVRRFLSLLLIVLLCFPVSVSLASGSSYIPCFCIGHCTCFVQEGDEGNFVKEIIKLLIKKKYLPKGTPTGLFSHDVTLAVMQFQKDNDLEETGMMDDDTLTLLIWDMLPEELDKVMPVTVASSFPDMCYIPTDGGKKRHASESCSGMLDPRKVSIRNAAAFKFDACKRSGCEAELERLMH